MPSRNSFWSAISHSIRALFHRKKAERELKSELHFHLEAQIEANIRAGMSPEAARQSALRDFGDVELAKEECREAAIRDVTTRRVSRNRFVAGHRWHLRRGLASRRAAYP